MTFRLKMVPSKTNIDFFRYAKVTFGISAILVVLSIVAALTMGLNFGIDFRGGTTIRTESVKKVDIGEYRKALKPLDLGDVSITEVFDPSFGPEKNVTQIRIEQQKGGEAATVEIITKVKNALRKIDPNMKFPSIESVGPKVSGELIKTAVLAVVLSNLAVLFYIWLRFEWQFSLGAVIALIHDVTLTIGIFSVLQLKFDLTIIAALLTIVGYSLNDTVVVFDRVRENLRRYKKMELKDLLSLSINETLSRTVMTSFTTLIALIALLVLGGDVIRGFVFAMTWGIIVGTYSSVFVASTILMHLGVKRDWSKNSKGAGTKYANIDA